MHSIVTTQNKIATKKAHEIEVLADQLKEKQYVQEKLG